MRKFAVLLAVAALPVLAQISLPQAPTKYVTDAAGVLDDARELALNERLAQHERETTNQVIVYVDRRVPEGTTLEEMATEAARTWGVGQKDKDNGVILFLFIEDRLSRIEVGYGLEDALTEDRSARILAEMRPSLRDENYSGAVEQGVEAIFTALAQPQGVAQTVPQSQLPAPQPVTTTPERNDAGRRSRNTVVMVVGLLFGAGLLGAAFLGLLFIIVKAIQTSGPHTWTQPRPPGTSQDNSWMFYPNPSNTFSSDSSSSDSSSSDSSSSSSSDFSGGGGDSGGGGASSNW